MKSVVVDLCLLEPPPTRYKIQEALPENRQEPAYLHETLEKGLGLVGVLYTFVSLVGP